jgi:hypothetical protein
MARDASITLDWAGGTDTFRIAWGEWRLLQEALDAGPPEIYEALAYGRWRTQHISEAIRIGLIGGGMPPADAARKTKAIVETRPPMECHTVARAIISAGLVGAPEENDELGKDGAADPNP